MPSLTTLTEFSTGADGGKINIRALTDLRKAIEAHPSEFEGSCLLVGDSLKQIFAEVRIRNPLPL